MDCQGYLVKSIERADLLGAVEQLLRMAEYDEKRRRLAAMRARRNVLETELPASELRESEAFQRLQRDIATLKQELAALSDDLEES